MRLLLDTNIFWQLTDSALLRLYMNSSLGTKNIKKRIMKRITDGISDIQTKKYIEKVVDAASDEEAGKIIASRNKEYALLDDVAKKKAKTAHAEAYEAILTNLDAVIDDARKEVFRKRLKDVPEAISLSYIAKEYFGKSRGWLMQKINNNTVHGSTARFSDSELRQFKGALIDLSRKLSDVAHSL